MLCVLPVAAAFGWAYYKTGAVQFETDHVAALFVCATAALVWLTLVTKQWVRDASFAYARALLATCDM